MVSTTKHTTATPPPSFPICVATTSSFSCSGVSSASPITMDIVMPHSDFSPTAVTITSPDPSTTCVPERQKGELGRFFTGSLSPVSDASSTTSPWPSTRTPSATNLSPASTCSTSPATTSCCRTSSCRPPRTTRT